MKPFKMLTWGLLGLSIAMAQPAAAQDRDADRTERGSEDRGGNDGRGSDGNDNGGGNGGGGRGNDEGGYSYGGGRGPNPPSTPTEPLRVGTQNTTAGGQISEDELSLTCGEGGWLETWLEDSDGNPIPDTYEYYCLD